MTRRLMAAGSLLVALALSATFTACAQKTPRLRVGGGEIQAPRLITRVEPAYPQEAKAKGIEGSVALEVVIDTDGKVIQVEVKESLPLLDKAAVAAVSQWKYTPSILNGKPIEVVFPVSVHFASN